jgi:alpha-D-ribose 1-methylphosphonate 5-triphosphate synthase subunit PhnI
VSYVASRGGEQAIAAAVQAFDALRGGLGTPDPDRAVAPLDPAQLASQLRFLVDRVVSEGGVYAPELAALAIKQVAGDPLEAAFLLRAWRSTRPRLLETAAHDGAEMRLIRRISATFKDIPGGQVLGPTLDYAHRLFRFELLDEDAQAFRATTDGWFQSGAERPTTFPKVLDQLRSEGLLPPLRDAAEPFDITRETLRFPAPRSAALAAMARGETGGLLAIAYSNMRGYGDIHPTVAELRVGWLPILMPHPITGEPTQAGEVPITECEIVSMFERQDGDAPRFGLGYGACFGHNEVKAISMAVLDRSLQRGNQHGAGHPSESAEFVLLHVDGIDSMGFCTHYKMPHYVTFLSDLDRLRRAQQVHADEVRAGQVGTTNSSARAES